MKPRILLVLIVGVVGGFGVGLAAGLLMAPPTQVAAPHSFSEPPVPLPENNTAASPKVDSPHAEAPLVHSPPLGTDLIAPAPRAAEGVVRGRFVDASGRPVAGVAVELRTPVAERPQRPRRNDFTDDESYFDAVMDFHRRNERLSLGAWRKVASGTDGFRVMRRLPPT
jgi:hypothetical protein